MDRQGQHEYPEIARNAGQLIEAPLVLCDQVAARPVHNAREANNATTIHARRVNRTGSRPAIEATRITHQTTSPT